MSGIYCGHSLTFYTTNNILSSPPPQQTAGQHLQCSGDVPSNQISLFTAMSVEQKLRIVEIGDWGE